MQRAKIGLDLITLDLKNARSRQRLRLKQQRMQALMFDQELSVITQYLRFLRHHIRKIEKLEKREADQRRIRNNYGGRNSMVGTYGK